MCNWIRNLPSDFFRVLKENALASVINSVGLWPFLGPQKVNLYFQHCWNSSISCLLSSFLFKIQSLRNVCFEFSRLARSKFMSDMKWNKQLSFLNKKFCQFFLPFVVYWSDKQKTNFSCSFSLHAFDTCLFCSFISSTFSKLNGTQSSNPQIMYHFHWNFLTETSHFTVSKRPH